MLLTVPAINHEDEVTDSDAAEEKDLGEMEQHKTIILHLLSQLKLGMDLTKVRLASVYWRLSLANSLYTHGRASS